MVFTVNYPRRNLEEETKQAKQEVLNFLCTKSQVQSNCVWQNLLASRMSDKVSQAF